jgi:hypothetical protein
LSLRDRASFEAVDLAGGGVYRSDDAGENWADIGGGGLPSDFGFPLIVTLPIPTAPR